MGDTILDTLKDGTQVTGVTGTISVSNTIAASVTGTVSAVQSGTWNIGTLTTITNPVPVTGTFWQTTQPVSGTVAATQSGTWNIGSVSTISNPVPVTGTFFQAVQPVSGTVSVSNVISASVTGTVAAVQSGTWNVATLSTITNPVSVTGTVSAIQSGTWNIGTLTTITNPVPVSQSGSWTVTNNPQRTANASVTSVAASATNVTLLSSNASRLNAMFVNDSSATLYLKFGATASTSSYTVKLGRDDYYEMPAPVYTGQVDGIWSSATGSVRVTELT